MSELLDSGARREFKSGAVRDIADDKGRCDLLPLSVVAKFLGEDTYKRIDYDVVLNAIGNYVQRGNPDELIRAVIRFCVENKVDRYTAILEVSKHYADGARKYAERNWEKGIDLHCFIDSGVRHYLKFKRGDKDEPHDRAFIWNMFGAVWTHQNKPELIDLPFMKESNTPDNDTSDIEDSITKEEIEKLRSESGRKRFIETCFG